MRIFFVPPANPNALLKTWKTQMTRRPRPKFNVSHFDIVRIWFALKVASMAFDVNFFPLYSQFIYFWFH